MKREKVAQKSRVKKISNIKITEIKYLRSKYSFSNNKESEIQDTGLMKIFELSSSNPKEPIFIGRWCDGEQKLNIDVVNPGTKETKEKFIKGEKGFAGHHPNSFRKDSHFFRVCIKLEKELYFSGKISFNVHHVLKASAGEFKLKLK